MAGMMGIPIRWSLDLHTRMGITSHGFGRHGSPSRALTGSDPHPWRWYAWAMAGPWTPGARVCTPAFQRHLSQQPGQEMWCFFDASLFQSGGVTALRRPCDCAAASKRTNKRRTNSVRENPSAPSGKKSEEWELTSGINACTMGYPCQYTLMDFRGGESCSTIHGLDIRPDGPRMGIPTRWLEQYTRMGIPTQGLSRSGSPPMALAGLDPHPELW